LVIEVTLAPCTECARAILQKAGELGAMTVIYYGELYRDPQGLYDLIDGGAQVAPLSVNKKDD
jgi:deoxycytidylate deaminase